VKRVFVHTLIILIGIPKLCLAQNRVIDSMKALLRTNIADTERVYTLQNIGMEYYQKHPDTAAYYWRSAIQLGDKYLKTKKGKEREAVLTAQSYALGSLAYLYSDGVKTDSAVLLMERSLDNFLALNDLKGAGQILNNLAATLLAQGKYDEAVRMQEKALTFAKKAGDLKTVAFLYQNMGLIRSNQGNIPLSVELYKRALAIRDSIQDYEGLGHSFYELGILYNTLNEYDESIRYFLKSLEARRKAGDNKWLAASMDEVGSAFVIHKNERARGKIYLDSARILLERSGDLTRLGYLYAHMGEYFMVEQKNDSALKYFEKSLLAREQNAEIKGVSLSLYKIGQVYFEQGKTGKAVEYGLRSYEIGMKHRFSETIRRSANLLRQAYSRSGQWEKAYRYFDVYKAWSDTVLNKENQRKALVAGMNYEFQKKSDALKLEQEREKTRLEAERDKQKTRTVYSLILLALVVVFAAFMVQRFRVSQKQKKLIETKNAQTEMQKQIIEEKQKEILDSIYYARRIQNALITSEGSVQRMLARLKKRSSPNS
jgi:tetratricopeptide (TPR) repeat protein